MQRCPPHQEEPDTWHHHLSTYKPEHDLEQDICDPYYYAQISILGQVQN